MNLRELIEFCDTLASNEEREKFLVSAGVDETVRFHILAIYE